ncbi:MAG: DNA replication/repair protein RecF [Gammaproteobacteria bacterium]|jgi:DNA replication and repair protein RecF
MSTFQRLEFSQFRNIEKLTLTADPCVNLIFGANGSGKTSILEAIHLLATGKSFRSTKTAPLINHVSNELTVFAALAGGVNIGMQKFRNQKPVLKLQGEKQPNWVEVARLLPVQVLDSTTFRLLEGSPRERRRFLDWGVFHVEPSFVEHWRNSRKCLANRNYLLKSNRPDRDQLRAWNAELAREAEQVDRARARYFDHFLPVFTSVLKEITTLTDLTLQYRRGWDADLGLMDVLSRNESQDIRSGITQNGPHRADIIVKQGGVAASEVLSRGQQKMLVSALKLAQGVIQSETENRRCVFLVDDLPAELDEANRGSICRFLQKMGGQVFLTCVDDSTLKYSLDWEASVTKFHVEHGKISH